MMSENGNRSEAKDVHTTRSLPFQVWTHVAATCDRTSIKLYVNGILDTIHDAPLKQIQSGPTDALIGATSFVGSSPPWFYCGLIDELALYDRALEAAEIQAIYRAGSAGKVKPTLGAKQSLTSNPP
jgi:hypothetical protein